MAAEGAVSKLGQDTGNDELIEGQRAMCHKRFSVSRSLGLVQCTSSSDTTHLTVRCVRELPPDEAVGLLQGDDSTGLMVWDAGQLMTKQVATLENCAAFVELGAGIGLVSLAAAVLHPSAHILCTDGNVECVEAASANTTLNAAVINTAHITAQQLLYGEGDDVAQAKQWCAKQGPRLTVLACDVIYHEEVVLPLFDTAAVLLGEGGDGGFYLSYVPRAWSDKENAEILAKVHTAATKHGFKPAQIIDTAPVVSPDGSESTLTNTLFLFERVETANDQLS